MLKRPLGRFRRGGLDGPGLHHSRREPCLGGRAPASSLAAQLGLSTALLRQAYSAQRRALPPELANGFALFPPGL